MKVVLLCLLQAACLTMAFHPRLGRWDYTPPEVKERNGLHEAQWFNQALDHFDPLETRTWEQRFWENWENYVPGGPVFLHIGGEAEASPGWLSYGAWYGWAQEHGAAMMLLEHRFYGQSKPTEDMSRENLKYLSSRQALDDLATFITATNERYNLTAPWITFGGSYPGSLSAWVRERYPHLVRGAVSSSGPLRAKLDFWEYFQTVADALDTTGPGCNPAISAAIGTIEFMLQQPDSWAELGEMFHLCLPLDGNNEMDVKTFIEYLMDDLAGVVQYNGRYPEDIFSVCAIMTDETLGSELERMAVLNERVLDMYGEVCVDASYASWIDFLSDESWSGDGVGYRQWIWQTCTEFGWYQTTNQPSGLYGNTLDLPLFESWCRDAYGDNFSHNLLELLVAATNVEYGSDQPEVTNVVFVHGTVDPWHAMGVLEDLNEDAPAIVVTGTSHCADMYPDDPSDPEEMLEARKKIGELVAKWIG